MPEAAPVTTTDRSLTCMDDLVVMKADLNSIIAALGPAAYRSKGKVCNTWNDPIGPKLIF